VTTFQYKGAVALLAVIAYLASFAMLPAAQANMIATTTVVQQEQRAQRVARVQELLAQERVEQQLVQLGVSPDEVQQRVAALSDEELTQLEDRLMELPAGGNALAVVGIVFLVLLLLDVLGILNLFT